MAIGVYSPGVKQPGCKVNHSPPSSVGVLNEWSYVSTPLTYHQDVSMEKTLVIIIIISSSVVVVVKDNFIIIIFIIIIDFSLSFCSVVGEKVFVNILKE